MTLKNRSPFSGATVVNNSPAVADEFRLSGIHGGVVVSAVDPTSPAAETGLQTGDVIVGIDRAKINSTKEMQRATAQHQDFWHVTLDRAGQIIESNWGDSSSGAHAGIQIEPADGRHDGHPRACILGREETTASGRHLTLDPRLRGRR